MARRALEPLSFDNSYARLPESFHAKLNPTPFSTAPYLISFNPAAADLIDLDPAEALRPEFAEVFGGSLLVPGMEPLAILLGEVRNERGEKWDLQLKGAGMTPFSRVRSRPLIDLAARSL